MTATTARPRVRTKSGLGRSQQRWGILFAAPAVIGFILFTFGPMVASLVIGMTDWTIGSQVNFVGMDNFVAISQDGLFWKSITATAYYAILAVPGGVLLAFLIAVLLNRAKHGRGAFRTIYYLPVLVPPVASAVLWLWLYNPDAGLLNSLLNALGLPGSSWVYGEDTAVPSVALMTIWGFGNMALVFLAGLQGVSQDLYEAAECDGANGLQRMWHITVPSLSPIILFNLITGMIAAVQVFDAAYVMTNGGPNNATLFYIFYLYTKAFAEAQLGYASALAWILFLVIVIVTAVLFKTSKAWVFYEGGPK
ncbi:sugar ABC transporter permease [Pseudarthrobacter phenanthrenivorans]|uniref:carbohydrate ABC transporter permease n=1 Tax=Pseudarthrobacter phenanthrenivorans TaxID=361575 RepID=UPI00344CE512